MAKLPPRKTVAPEPEPHVHEFKADLCDCGAKVVVVEPAPETVACYWHVIGHPGYHKAMGVHHHCSNRILKGSEPPYCFEHLAALKLKDALSALVGVTIKEIDLDSMGLTVSHKDGYVTFYATASERYGDTYLEWSV